MLHKVGDKVVIAHQYYGHHFEIGEIVTIIEVDPRNGDYRAIGEYEDGYHIRDDEIEYPTDIDILPDSILDRIDKLENGKILQ